jgi:hypothetical protein
VHFGFPYRIGGPTADYYGPVAACLMNLDELHEIVMGGQYPALLGLDASARVTEFAAC